MGGAVFPWRGHELLLKVAKDAIRSQGILVTGGWANRSSSTGIYRGGAFEYEGERWAACSGKQRPSYARLLDATTCFMSRSMAKKAVALLDPAPRQKLPNGVYHERFAAAAWHGLGIVWAPVSSELALPAADLDPPPAIDADFADEIRRVIRKSVTHDWFAAKRAGRQKLSSRRCSTACCRLEGMWSVRLALPAIGAKASLTARGSTSELAQGGSRSK